MRVQQWRVMQPVGKPLAALAMLACVAASGLAGYFAGALRQNEPTLMPSSQVAGLEYFLQPRSFSEIEQAKALLEALASQIVSDVRTRKGVARVKTAGHERPQEPSESAENTKLSEAIRELEQRMEEFRGIAQELLLAQELLHLLHKQGNNDRWLKLYLNILYEHPTNELVGALAERALYKAKAAGRECEVFYAFQLVRDIPFDFNAKSQITAAMLDCSLSGQLAPGAAEPN